MSDINPQVASPNIEFHRILGELVAASPYNSHRRMIWESVGVTSAALSQYVMGRARPRFETLCLLADFFGVSLDYLVRGKEAQSPTLTESDSMVRYMDLTLADLQAKAGAQTWFAARVGQILMEAIDQGTKKVLATAPHGAGLLSDGEISRIEAHSVHCKLITSNLHHDLLEVDGKVVAGRYAQIAADNLERGTVYQYLIPEKVPKQWNSIVHTYRKTLSEIGVTTDQLKQTRFMQTDTHFFTGCYLYRLDLARFSRNEPLLHAVLQSYISDDNWVGFTRHMTSDSLSGPALVYELGGLRLALQSFDEIWGKGGTL